MFGLKFGRGNKVRNMHIELESLELRRGDGCRCGENDGIKSKPVVGDRLATRPLTDGMTEIGLKLTIVTEGRTWLSLIQNWRWAHTVLRACEELVVLPRLRNEMVSII